MGDKPSENVKTLSPFGQAVIAISRVAFWGNSPKIAPLQEGVKHHIEDAYSGVALGAEATVHHMFNGDKHGL